MFGEKIHKKIHEKKLSRSFNCFVTVRDIFNPFKTFVVEFFLFIALREIPIKVQLLVF